MITVSGVGCCLVDVLYGNIDFSSVDIRPFLSVDRGDGGLSPGHLVFLDDFEKFSQVPFGRFLERITHNCVPDKINIGGPSIVPLIHLAQLTHHVECAVNFYGRGGTDKNGEYLLSTLEKTPVSLKDYRLVTGHTPSTFVFSDPEFDDGHGERMFVNSIGAANSFSPDQLDDDFFHSDIVVFGGTALVPSIHDQLDSLLLKSKMHGAVTVVNTVFDFRNEKENPGKKWPLGASERGYKYIDLLITDHVEALRLSGTENVDDACAWFMRSGLSSFVITNGSNDLYGWSDGRIFKGMDLKTIPVCQQIKDELITSRSGDTTGCGDNFVGGMLYSLVKQLQESDNQPALMEAISWGVVSGGYTCFYIGGTYLESGKGDKLAKIEPYYTKYRKQIGR